MNAHTVLRTKFSILTLLTMDNYENTVLHQAVRLGDVELVETLLKKNVDPNIKTPEGKTALYLAIVREDLEMVQVLLRYGASITNVNEFEADGVLYLALDRQTRYYRRLHQPELTPLIEEDLLLRAVNIGEIVDTILEHGMASIDAEQAEYFKLCDAIVNDQMNIALPIVHDTEDINYPSVRSENPLKIALIQNNFFLAVVLLMSVANPNLSIGLRRESILVTALKRKNVGFVELLLRDYQRIQMIPLPKSGIFFLNTDLILSMLNIFDNESDASTYEHFKTNVDLDFTSTAKSLVKYASNISLTDTNGNAMLHLVTHWPCFVKYLVKNGAKVDARNAKGQTPLHLASTKILPETIRYLINHGAQLTAIDKRGKTILHFAAKGFLKNFKYIADLTISSGLVNVNVRNAKGSTPLHSAWNRCENFVELLKRGADLNVKSRYGYAHHHHSRPDDEKFCEVLDFVRRLQVLGYEVKNDTHFFHEVCQKNNSRDLPDAQIRELEKLKNEVLASYPKRTLYDLLVMDRGDVVRYVGNENLAKIFSRCNKDFESDYKYFGGLLNSRYHRGVVRRNKTDLAKNRLNLLLSMNLPDICCEKIFKFLNDSEVGAFAEGRPVPVPMPIPIEVKIGKRLAYILVALPGLLILAFIGFILSFVYEKFRTYII